MEFQYQYGEDVCNSTCGVPYLPTTYTPSTPTTTFSTTPGRPTTTTIPELKNKTCVEEGKYYEASSNDPKQIKNIQSWEECAYLCRINPDCEGFTWAGPEYADSKMTSECALKTELTDGGELVGLYRGTKECGDCEY